MSRKTPAAPPLWAVLEKIRDAASDERYKLQHAGALLKLLAETNNGKHIGIDDEDGAAWRDAEYLADQIGTHAEALGDLIEQLDHASMQAKRGENGDDQTPAPPGSGLRLIGGDDDAA